MYVIFIVQHKRGSVAPPFPLNSLDSSPALFDTASQAVDTALELDFIYPVSPEEVARPTFFVVDAGVGQYLLSPKNLSHYKWEEFSCTAPNNDRPCGKCSACLEGMALQDIKYLHENSLYHT